jgi:hypothetical protein
MSHQPPEKFREADRLEEDIKRLLVSPVITRCPHCLGHPGGSERIHRHHHGLGRG